MNAISHQAGKDIWHQNRLALQLVCDSVPHRVFAVQRLSSKPSSVEQRLWPGSGCCHRASLFPISPAARTVAFTRGQGKRSSGARDHALRPWRSVPNGKGGQQRKSGILDCYCWPAYQYLYRLGLSGHSRFGEHRVNVKSVHGYTVVARLHQFRACLFQPGPRLSPGRRTHSSSDHLVENRQP